MWIRKIYRLVESLVPGQRKAAAGENNWNTSNIGNIWDSLPQWRCHEECGCIYWKYQSSSAVHIEEPEGKNPRMIRSHLKSQSLWRYCVPVRLQNLRRQWNVGREREKRRESGW